MPNPKQQMPAEFPADLLNKLSTRNNPDNLTQEISLLRGEIAALRAELIPVPSLILTGRKIMDEFEKLRNNP